MSYIKAEDILPKELLETIQQYVNGQLIYIPCKEKLEWGSNTDSKIVYSPGDIIPYIREKSICRSGQWY